MQIDYSAQPAYTVAYVRLAAGEELVCESGSMVALSAGVEVAASTGGGIMSAAVRKVLGEESFFRARYVSRVDGGWVAIAPKYPGDAATIEVAPGREMIVQTGSVLAHGVGVETDVNFTGLGGLVMREGLTVLRAHGAGQLLICSYGGLQRFTPGPGERMIVDTGHLVAWSAGMGLRMGPLSGVVSSALTGEGFVAELTGPGEVWIQTRAEASLRSWLFPTREQNSRD